MYIFLQVKYINVIRMYIYIGANICQCGGKYMNLGQVSDMKLVVITKRNPGGSTACFCFKGSWCMEYSTQG